mmetsp:Transcript_35000/g.71414  ORF Transcript_35000/g.71414 Transcript_35000/m.71414 type:complete len:174 (+) Transcript_35000:138-659(+)
MVSVWNPEPPPWFTACSSAASALEVPQPVETPLVVSDLMTYSSVSAPPPPGLTSSCDFNPSATLEKLLIVEKRVTCALTVMLEVIGEGDPFDENKRITVSTLQLELENDVASIHQLLTQWREHQAYELLIQELERAVDDHQSANDSIEKARENVSSTLSGRVLSAAQCHNTSP